jgi:RES domain
MAKFIDDEDYMRFAKYLKYESRHFLDTAQRRFINAVLQTSKNRSLKMDAGTVVWRAAIGYVNKSDDIKPEDYEFAVCIEPHPIGRMKPLKGRAFEGRINPKGIPCLYTSTTAETAMSETRPSASTILTVAKLVMMKDVTLVNCSLPDQARDEGHQEFLADQNWSAINGAFSEPVDRNDDLADYAPTQVLAEAFRNFGFEGIIYNSRLADGKNIALFDIDIAAVASRRLYCARNIQIEYGNLNDEILYEDQYKDLPGVFEPRPDPPPGIGDDDVPF